MRHHRLYPAAAAAFSLAASMAVAASEVGAPLIAHAPSVAGAAASGQPASSRSHHPIVAPPGGLESTTQSLDPRFDVGDVFPDFALPSLDDGAPTRLSDFRGRKVMLHVFASW